MRTLIAISLLIGGCQNACQQLCSDMASYAEDECNTSFSKSELKSCQKKYADADDETLTACEQHGPKLKEEWDCKKVKEYTN